MMRLTMSEPPPAPNETIILMVWLGYSWACGADASTIQPIQAISALESCFFTLSSLRRGLTRPIARCTGRLSMTPPRWE